ncbi:MAG: AraC family ligand binding domain-containing protein [Azoarcus sp.]|jgi:quercetin dioxygenase-like cupin family protein|nr:AraC family ligand binding domain-containing protein [Azoarcus sp.]
MSPLAALAAIDAIRAHFAARHAANRETPAIAAELRNILALLETVDFSRADEEYLRPSGHPVVRQLQQTPPQNVDAATGAIFRAFLPQLDALPWRYSYAPRPDAPDIGERMAWAELVGPIAPFRSDKVCLGLTAIGPRLLYPRHYHPAVETYLVVSGAAAWTAAGITRIHPPGALILHPANIVHAMETGDEPLLAAYAWTGDVETLSAYEDDAGAAASHAPGKPNRTEPPPMNRT